MRHMAFATLWSAGAQIAGLLVRDVAGVAGHAGHHDSDSEEISTDSRCAPCQAGLHCRAC